MRYALFLGAIAATALSLVPVTAPAGLSVAQAATETEFVCTDNGTGLSAVDVLQATGEHDAFLGYLREFDPEGYEILTDAGASDKTIWAPTDAAFAKLGDDPQSASPEDIKAVLGYHITPPRRTPDGDYPIVTFEYLADGGQIIHQTRTGILTESDQRVRTNVENGVFTVQGIALGSTAWCTEAGSIFSIDEVITDVAVPSWFERTLGMAIYLLLFQHAYVSAIIGIAVLALVGLLIVRRLRK